MMLIIDPAPRDELPIRALHPTLSQFPGRIGQLRCSGLPEAKTVHRYCEGDSPPYMSLALGPMTCCLYGCSPSCRIEEATRTDVHSRCEPQAHTGIVQERVVQVYAHDNSRCAASRVCIVQHGKMPCLSKGPDALKEALMRGADLKS